MNYNDWLNNLKKNQNVRSECKKKQRDGTQHNVYLKVYSNLHNSFWKYIIFILQNWILQNCDILHLKKVTSFQLTKCHQTLAKREHCLWS